ncbi:MAG: RNA polymerase sigma factor SigZ [Bacteroidota bacterium]
MDHKAEHIESLYRRFHDNLKRFILHRLSDEAAAEDLLQEVFLRIHSRIDSLVDSSRVESWVFQIARNLIIDYYRSKKETEQIDESALSVEPEPEADASEQLAPAIREFINELPEPYREALILTEFEGISQKELAERLGLSFSGAKSRVQRARAMLKDMLMRCCHFEFDRYGTIIDYHEISCSCCRESPSQQ